MKKQLGVIVIVLMTVFIGFGIIIPVMPDIVAGTGRGEFHLAWMLSLYSAASFLMSPIWGSLSDKYGRRPILLIGLIGFCVSFFVFGMADGSLALMYASRIIGGLFSGAVTACAVAYVADITTEETRTKGMGLVGMAIGLGFVIGPGVGGLLSLVSNGAPFYASSILSLIMFVFVLMMVPESLTPERRKAPSGPKTSRWTAFAGPLKYLYVLSFFVSFTLAGLETTFQLFQMQKIGAEPFHVGIMFFVSGIVGALIQGGVVRKRIKNGAEPQWILIGLVLSAVGFILILFSTNVITAAIYMSIFGAGNAFIRPCVISLITKKTTVGQGVATGLNSSMDSLGRIAGPLFAMLLYGWQIELPFIVGGVLCIAAIVLVQRFRALDPKGAASKNEAAIQ